ncbi:MAG TPA: NADH-quinone oxidoreductase subunit L, partial [Nitrospiria bacterium]|nr:NADH-quinone oxidoreductase subunit L [Nitrospiria bacterium]
MDLIWLIPAFPLLASIINGLYGHRLSERAVSVTAVGSVGLSFAVTLKLFADLLKDPTPQVSTLYTWIPGSDLEIEFNALLDPLSGIM